MKKKIEFKKQVFEYCSKILKEKVDFMDKEIKETQHQANQFKGAMESRYDTFKEELQARKNQQIKQQSLVLNDLETLNRLQLVEMDIVRTGAIIETVDENNTKFNYFFFASIGSKPHKISGETYIILNINTPLGNVFNNKKLGDIANFRSKTYKITSIY